MNTIRALLASAALIAAARAEDAIDPRVKEADEILRDEADALHGGTPADVDRLTRAAIARAYRFLGTLAPENTVVIVGASDGKTLFIAAGRGRPDGAFIALMTESLAENVRIRAGDAADGGFAGDVLRLAWKDSTTEMSGEKTKDVADDRALVKGKDWLLELRRGQPAAGGEPEGQSPGDQGKEVQAWEKKRGELKISWGKSSDEALQKIGLDLQKTAPRGPLAIVTYSGFGMDRMLVVAGGNGCPRDPHGMSIEVVEPGYRNVLVIAGNPHGSGKPGVAKGPPGAVLVQGREDADGRAAAAIAVVRSFAEAASKKDRTAMGALLASTCTKEFAPYLKGDAPDEAWASAFEIFATLKPGAASVDSGLADVEVEFLQRGRTVRETMRLVLEDGAWKIQDM
ncbi:MAG: hypothetical protein AAB074_03845 [Planctomycetota bacterium]